MAPSLGLASAVSQFAQVFASYTHYPRNWEEARKDKDVGKASVRMWPFLAMCPTFKALPSTTLQSECLSWMFSCVKPREGHLPVRYPGAEGTLGTWRLAKVQENFAAVFYARMQIKAKACDFSDRQWGTDTPALTARVVLQNLTEGLHDVVIASALKLWVTSASEDAVKAKKKQARKGQTRDEEAAALGPVVKNANVSYTPDALTAPGGDGFRMAWRAWKAKYLAMLENPAKATSAEKKLDMTNFTVKKTRTLVETGDATSEEDWRRIMKEAKKKGVLGKDGNMKMVIITSPPWGVLESNRSAYLQTATGSSDAPSTYSDIALTDKQLGDMFSNAFVLVPEDTPFLLHLPPLELGRYANIAATNGWEATRTPVTVVSKPAYKVPKHCTKHTPSNTRSETPQHTVRRHPDVRHRGGEPVAKRGSLPAATQEGPNVSQVHGGLPEGSRARRREGTAKGDRRPEHGLRGPVLRGQHNGTTSARSCEKPFARRRWEPV